MKTRRASFVVGLVSLASLCTAAVWWATSRPGVGASATPEVAAPISRVVPSLRATPPLVSSTKRTCESLFAEPPSTPLFVDDDVESSPAPVGSRVDVVWRGAVVDHEGEPIRGARVWAVPNGPALQDLGLRPRPYAAFIGLGTEGLHRLDYVDLARMPSTKTDAAGEFSIEAPHVVTDVELGRYTIGLPEPVIAVAAAGFITRTTRVAVSTYRAFDLGSIALEPESVITGRIVDADDSPLARVSVEVSGMWVRAAFVETSAGLPSRRPGVDAFLRGLHSTTTDDDGRFALHGLWGGKAFVMASAPGFRRVSADFDLEPAQTLDVGDLVLPRGRSLSGVVVDEDGAAIVGAEVIATSRPISHAGRGCVIQSLRPEDDTIALELTVANRWSSHVTRTGDGGRFSFAELDDESHAIYARAPGREPVRVDEADVDCEPQLVLVPEATLRVELVDEHTGRPVDGATVFARRRSNARSDDVQLDVEPLSGGMYLVHGVGPLGTRLDVRSPAHAATRAEAPGVGSSQTQTFELSLGRGCTLSGTVVDERGAALSGVSVSVIRLEGGERYGVARTTGPDGRFEFSGLAHGPVGVKARLNEHVAWPRIVDLAAGEHRSVDEIVLRPQSVLTVWVTTADGDVVEDSLQLRLVPQASVEAYRGLVRSEYMRRRGRGGKSSTFTALHAGRYTLTATTEDQRAESVVELGVGEVRELELRLPRPAVIHGRVTSGGLPVPDACVRTSDPGRAPAAITLVDGSYSLEVVQPGEVTLLVSAPRGQTVVGPTLEVNHGDVRAIDLQIGTASLRGIVVDAREGRPIGFVPVVLGNERHEQTTYADPSGQFSFEWLEAGSYHVSVPRATHRPWKATLPMRAVLADSGRGVATLSLERGATVSGHVTTADGGRPSNTDVGVWRVGEATPFDEADVHGGRYEIGGLSPGTYRIAPIVDDDETAPAGAFVEFDVRGAETLAYDLRLDP